MYRVAFRGLLAALLLTLVAACGLVEGDGRHLQPLSSAAESKLSRIGATPGSGMMIRLFKQESVLEVWKETKSGRYALFETYEICAWSGELGPKFKEGDRQSPEGFYSISPGLMNPKSNYYLAVNTGFPNKFDRVHGRTGSNLMIHGDCSSRGCYAMTDEQIAEIYALAREAFAGGQRTFQLQLYPFRMTAENLAQHADSPHIDFWKNLKVGYDAFEISKRLPRWDVCERSYIFNHAGGALNPAGACPAATTEPALMAEVQAKQIADEQTFQTRVAELTAKAEDKAEAEARRKAEAEAAAQRTAELNAAINERTEAIGQAMNGFFGSIFGAASDDGTQSAAAAATEPAPVPAPVSERPN